MEFQGLDLRCPLCHGDLAATTDPEREFVCGRCDRRFPVIAGIPDFRVFPDPYIDLEADRAKSRHVAARLGDLDFAALVAYYYSQTTVVPPHHARAFTRSLLGAAARSRTALDAWEGASDTGRLTLLEIGCGTAPLLVHAARRYRLVAGIDIALRWLVVAKRRLADAGVQVPLVCACAEALPLAPAGFDRVVAESTLEHLSDQPRGLREIDRVLRPDGRVFLSTPNRRFVGPDPHVGLILGGWLPDRWVAAWARRQGAIPPHRRLLSRGELLALVQAAGFRVERLFLPDVPADQRAHQPMLWRVGVGAYDAVRRTRAGRALLFLIGPILYAVCARAATATAGES